MSSLSVFEFPLPLVGVDTTPFETTTAAVEGSVSSEATTSGGGGSAGILTSGIDNGKGSGFSQFICNAESFSPWCKREGPSMANT